MEFDRYKFISVDPEESDSTWDFYHQPENGYYTSSMISDLLGFGYTSCKKRWEIMKTPPAADGSRKKETNQWMLKALEHGKLLEPEAINQFYKCLPQWIGTKPGMAFFNEKILASSDQIMVLRENPNEIAMLEVKCPISPKDIVEPNEIPTKWLVQCQVEMACWNVHKCFLFIYQPIQDMESNFKTEICFEIIYSEIAIKKIIKEIEDFDNNYIKKNIQPGNKKKDQELIRLLNTCVIKVELKIQK